MPERSMPAGTVQNPFTVQGTTDPDPPVYSARIHPAGQPGAAPLLELGREGQLRLRFETVGFESHSYRVTFTHHNPDWSESAIPPDRYMEGYHMYHITGGTLSRSSRPYYRMYQFDFPDNDINFRLSGNYMLHVEDSDTDKRVISLPFYLYENEGQITSSTELVRTPRQDRRVMHRPVSRYTLPGFVDQPRFDLNFLFSQNQFWGRAIEPREVDFSDPNDVWFETSSARYFTGDYEFRVLNLTDPSQLSSRIVDIDPTQEPQRVILRDDAAGFTHPVSIGTPRQTGPAGNAGAVYLDVHFRFDADKSVHPEQLVYLVGDFNHWQIDPDQQMKYNQSSGRWETSVIMKEGTYRYKYVLLENGRINDLAFDTLFFDGEQEYHAFVYLRDINEFYYRLLQVNTFYRESR